MEQHGEWDLCDIRAGETGCFAESLPAGYANLIDFPLDFEGELNDGRRTHAPNLTWWLEIGVGWTSEVAGKKPLSYAVLVEDHFGMVDGHQHTYENYHWVPSHGDWVNYYTGRMPTAGSLVRMKHHVHMNLLHKSFFVAATSEELGLLARPIGPDGQPMGAKEVPGAFFSHGGTLGKLIDAAHPWASPTYNAEHNTWPVGVVSADALGAASLEAVEERLLSTIRGLPGGDRRIICSLSRGLLEVDEYPGYLWDRAGRSDCREWTFRRGDHFTSVSLLRYHGGKVGPWSPHMTPPRLPSHNQWNIYFESSSEVASHYFLYSALIHDPTQRLRRHALRELLLMMNWRIVPANGDTPLSTHVMASTLRLRRLAPLTLVSIAIALATLLCCAYKRAKRTKSD